MFNRKKAVPRPAVNGFSSLIADNLSIRGDLEFSDGLKVDGRVCGSISFKSGTTSLLAIRANGVVEGDVSSYDALIDGTIAGAALDVTDPEPLPKDDPLLDAPNLIVVPHIGSATRTARERMAEIAVENLLAALAGQPMPHPVGTGL